MQGSGFSKSTGLPAITDVVEPPPAKLRREDVEHWLAVLAASVPREPSHSLGIHGGESTPQNWRQGVEPLTLRGKTGQAEDLSANFAGESATVQGSNPETSQDAERLQVRVSAGDLGEIALLIEHSEGGLRLQVGTETAAGLAIFSAESEAMMQALIASGLTVKSLSFVRMDGLGTDLAQSNQVPGIRSRRSPSDSPTASTSEPQRRKSRRLDVIG